MKCYFCKQQIQGRPSRHHRKPRRFFKRRENHRQNNIVLCCEECHQLFHRVYDNPRLTLARFEEIMKPLKYGEGLFAGD